MTLRRDTNHQPAAGCVLLVALASLAAAVATPAPTATRAPAATPAPAATRAPAAPRAPAAQAPAVERFGGRLSRLPVDLVTASTIRGEGVVSAELRGRALTLSAEFQGLSSPVTAVHVHNAPRARRGGVAFPVEIEGPSGTAGVIAATVTLDDAQAAELRAGRYYLQLHTEANPGGELRGWLLPPRD